MSMIKGIDIILHVKASSGTDGFNRPVYTETSVTIKDVLVTPAGSSDSVTDVNMSGKTAAYDLHIPKGDSHVWENTTVEFFGKRWRTVGYPQKYIGRLLPLAWDRVIRVERHE